MQIGGFQKSSLLDYPGKIAAIVFTRGCNFRCGYCHNPELFGGGAEILEEEIFEFLRRRVGKLDGVVVTGGEPCLQTGLAQFIKKIKELGFLVKLDTNGSCPGALETLLERGFLDYVAMDIKAPLEDYKKVAGVNVEPALIQKSIDLVVKSGVDYEFRTTVVQELLGIDDFEKIGRLISGVKRYYLQKFVPSKVSDESFMSAKTYTDEEFEQIKEILKKYVEWVEVR